MINRYIFIVLSYLYRLLFADLLGFLIIKIDKMEKDIKIVALPPAHKAVRGFSSSIDVSDQFIIYFNANTVVLRPH